MGQYRARLDASARVGVPAHCTVYFPYVAATDLDDELRRQLRDGIAGTPAFGYRFSTTAWFGDTVLWLAPDDPQPFRDLTTAVQRSCPDLRPYDGAFDEVVPHLTVAHGVDVTAMRAAERAIAPRLPVSGEARQASLLVEASGGWRVSDRFSLGAVGESR